MTNQELCEQIALAIKLLNTAWEQLNAQRDQEQVTTDTDDPTAHPLVGRKVVIMSGKNQGVSGTVEYVRPSKYKAGFLYASIHDPKGTRVFADVDAVRVVDTTQQQIDKVVAAANAVLAPKPPAPSVRRPVARKANGSVPW